MVDGIVRVNESRFHMSLQWVLVTVTRRDVSKTATLSNAQMSINTSLRGLCRHPLLVLFATN